MGCSATLPVISPLSNNIKLGGSEPDAISYFNTTSDTALTLSVLIVPLNIVSNSPGVIQLILPVTSLLTVYVKLKSTVSISG